MRAMSTDPAARAISLQAELQSFLESGFDTFGAMRGAKDFLDTVVRREQGIAAWLFDPASLDGRAAELSFPPVP